MAHKATKTSPANQLVLGFSENKGLTTPKNTNNQKKRTIYDTFSPDEIDKLYDDSNLSWTDSLRLK